MTPWWIVALFVVIGAVGFAGYKSGINSMEVTCQKHDEAQQQITIAAENGVIATIGKQQTLTQESEHAYHTGINVIDDLYRVQPNTIATGHNMPAVPSPARRTIPPQNSRKFNLTPQQSDIEEQKLISLWEWVRMQAMVK